MIRIICELQSHIIYAKKKCHYLKLESHHIRLYFVSVLNSTNHKNVEKTTRKYNRFRINHVFKKYET